MTKIVKFRAKEDDNLAVLIIMKSALAKKDPPLSPNRKMNAGQQANNNKTMTTAHTET